VFWDIGGVILAMESVREGHRRAVGAILAADAGPAVDYRVEDLREIPELLGIEG
jgi:hypothetical protein